MIRYFLLIFLLSLPLKASILEKYVSALAGGGGDGSSGSPYTWVEMITDINSLTGLTSSVRYNVKSDGDYILSSSSSITTGGGNLTTPVIIRGYDTTIADGYLGRSNDNGSLITTNMPIISYNNTSSRFSTSSSGDYIILENLVFTSTVTNTLVDVDTGCMLIRCKITNASTDATSARSLALGAQSIAFESEIVLSSASGGKSALQFKGSGSKAFGCKISVPTTNAADCIENLTSATIANCTISGGKNGIFCTNNTASGVYINNTITDAFEDGISLFAGTQTPVSIINNLITDNVGDAIDVGSGTPAVICYSYFRDNATSVATVNDWYEATNRNVIDSGVTGDTSTDYVNYANGDYRIKSTSPAVNAGSPSKTSIGGYQRDQTGASGSSEKSHTFVQ